MTEPLSIDLPVCDTCNKVSPLPASNWSGKTWCVGSLEMKHPKTKMVVRHFREVREKEPSQ